MKIFYSPRFLQHDTGWGHPECAMRLQVILEYLRGSGLSFELVEPKPATERELSLVHDSRYLNQLAHPSLIHTYFPDTPIDKNTYAIARLAAGAALGAARACLQEKFAFALVRPPGHHAKKVEFGGFCYLNNMAVAVANLLRDGSARRVLIVDFDIHHGNGTQEIFYNEPRVFYFSIHQRADSIYPGTGFESESNEHIRNVELPIGVRDAEYIEKFRANLADITFEPDVIGVSAGFDSFGKDNCCGQLTRISDSRTYRKVGELIRQKAGGASVFAVLEGGYYLDALGENVFNFLSAFV
ncbi:MAG: histone deacetylase family protein [Candidatus Micrarchaeia archaeon]